MKKVTVKQQVLEQFKFGGAKLPKDIYKRLNGACGLSAIYSTFTQLRKDGLIVKTPKGYYLASQLPLNKNKLTPVNKSETYTKRKYTKRKAKETKQLPPTHPSQYVKSLEYKVVSLHQQVEQLNNQNTALKIDLLDQTAVINYLEKKLGV
jgi:hypothetical protein